MRITVRTALHVFFAIAFFMAAKSAISYTALSSFAHVIIRAQFDHDDLIDIYFAASNKAGFREEYRKSSTLFIKDTTLDRKVPLGNHVARILRIDPGTHPGQVKLYSLRLVSRFGPGVLFDHRRIYESFIPNEAIASFRLEHDHVLIESSGNDPYLTLKGELIQRNFFLQWLLPLILGLLSFLACRRATPKALHAFGDIDSKRSSSGINIGSLDGVRGLAALLVLGQHTGLTQTGGIFGVWLFFCLSGFLLATPFVRQPRLAVSPSYMGNYLFRRIKRIVPLYYVMITVTILFAGKIDAAFRHYLFLQADGHFWTISQEMFFYLLLPLVMAGAYLVCRDRRPLHLVFLAVCAYAANRLLKVDVISLYGNGASLKPMAGIFLTGVLIAFLHHSLMQRDVFRFSRPRVAILFSTAGAALLGFCLYLSSGTHGALRNFNPFETPAPFGLGAALFILATLLSGTSFLGRLMRVLPLRAMGIVGYSFYLLHPKMIECVRAATVYFINYKPTGIAIFLLAGIATYLVSIFTYSYIERPFIKK